MADDSIHYFGIRHHGPGSARRLVQALNELTPSLLLVEGPTDADEMVSYIGRDELKPPVALLCYPADNPDKAAFWPFAEFSPEYQAIKWANEQGVPTHFIDLPSAVDFPEADQEKEEDDETSTDEISPIRRDPIGALANAAGYEDGESWWTNIIEEGGKFDRQPELAFDAIADAMAALRETEEDVELREQRREAFMRRQIADYAKSTEGKIAVVCGAWHVPALKVKRSAKDDRATLKGMKKLKTVITWAPWTAPRLSFRSGYGAGIAAPGWCKHIWENEEKTASHWLAKIAALLRKNGHIVSTASLIEAERLAMGLCILRDKPAPGFEELREAAIACLCFGEELLWQTIEVELLIGNDVGEVPEDTPLAPLLLDLKKCQTKARMKPEALERDLAIDLRSDSGLYRSTLLHRLNILNVPWGKIQDAGRSRGTFRERWKLAWEPEFAVRLVEHLIHGPTIEKAANGLLSSRMRDEAKLGMLSKQVELALTADLVPSIAIGIEMLEKAAAASDDCGDVLSALPSLANTIRYGEARAVQLDTLPALLDRLILQASIALPFASRNLDQEAANTLCQSLSSASFALELVELTGPVLESWENGLRETLEDRQATPKVAGKVASILLKNEAMQDDEAALLLEQRISPGIAPLDASGYFEGFFEGSAQQLIYSDGLRNAVTNWLVSIEQEEFIANLPLFRRVFSDLDAMERKRLIDAVLGKRAKMPKGMDLLQDDGVAWQTHLTHLQKMLNVGSSNHE